MKTPQDDRITDWRVLARGAVGVELSLWCGFGIGKNLFHVYARLGVVTLYASAEHLKRFLDRMERVREEMRRHR